MLLGIGLLRRGALLHEAVCDAAGAHIRYRRPVLRRRYPPRQPPGHAGGRRVLAHQRHHHVPRRKRLGQPVQHPAGVVRIPRQHQMPHDDAPLHNAVFVIDRPSCLAEHLPDGIAGHGEVVRCAGQRPGQIAVGVFQVGQVDVHPALQRPQRLHPLIAAAVVHHRHRQPRLQRRQYPRQKVGGRHQLDVVGALGDQLVKYLPQPPGCDVLSRPSGGDAPILAVAAPQGAAGEEHRARAPRAGDGRLLPLVQRRPRHPQTGGHTAIAVSPLRRALRGAQAGTEGAGHTL